MLRMSGALAKSTDVMKAMSSLLRVPEIQATMRELSKEMTKVLHNTILEVEDSWFIILLMLAKKDSLLPQNFVE